MRSRGGRIDADEHVQRLGVSLRPSEGGFTGSLRVDGKGGETSVREVQDQSCAEVVQGLAVIASIALGARDPDDSATDDAPESVPPQKHADQAPSPEEEDHLVGHTFGAPEAVTVEAGTLQFRTSPDYTLTSGIALGVIPGVVMPRFDFAASLARFVVVPGGESYLSSNVLRVRWTFLGPVTRHDGAFSTDAWGIAAGIGSCSAFTYDTRGWEVLACGDFGAGMMNLNTKDVSGTSVATRKVGFGTAALELGAQYNFGSVVHAGFRLGGQMQFGDFSAKRPDGRALFGPSLFGGYTLLGVGIHF